MESHICSSLVLLGGSEGGGLRTSRVAHNKTFGVSIVIQYLCLGNSYITNAPASFRPLGVSTVPLRTSSKTRTTCSRTNYRKPRMISNSFNKQHAKGNPRKLAFDHITVISTARTYLSITNGSGLTRAFHPYIFYGVSTNSLEVMQLRSFTQHCVCLCA